MILPDGSIVDTYYEFPKGEVPGFNPAMQPESPLARCTLRSGHPVDATGTIYAATSRDGGATWSKGVEVSNNAGGYANGVRCCLFAADIDSVTHLLYTAWEGGIGSTDPVYESFSSDGTTWTSPVRVSRGDVPACSGSTSTWWRRGQRLRRVRHPQAPPAERRDRATADIGLQQPWTQLRATDLASDACRRSSTPPKQVATSRATTSVKRSNKTVSTWCSPSRPSRRRSPARRTIRSSTE